MRGRLIVGLIGGGSLLLLGGLMAGCMPDTTAPTLQQRPTADQPQQPTAVAVNLPPTEMWLEPFTDQTCLDCHTNQEKLVELAEPDPPKETLSEGPG